MPQEMLRVCLVVGHLILVLLRCKGLIDGPLISTPSSPLVLLTGGW